MNLLLLFCHWFFIFTIILNKADDGGQAMGEESGYVQMNRWDMHKLEVTVKVMRQKSSQ